MILTCIQPKSLLSQTDLSFQWSYVCLLSSQLNYMWYFLVVMYAGDM